MTTERSVRLAKIAAQNYPGGMWGKHVSCFVRVIATEHARAMKASVTVVADSRKQRNDSCKSALEGCYLVAPIELKGNAARDMWGSAEGVRTAPATATSASQVVEIEYRPEGVVRDKERIFATLGSSLWRAVAGHVSALFMVSLSCCWPDNSGVTSLFRPAFGANALRGREETISWHGRPQGPWGLQRLLEGTAWATEIEHLRAACARDSTVTPSLQAAYSAVWWNGSSEATVWSIGKRGHKVGNFVLFSRPDNAALYVGEVARLVQVSPLHDVSLGTLPVAMLWVHPHTSPRTAPDKLALQDPSAASADYRGVFSWGARRELRVIPLSLFQGALVLTRPTAGSVKGEGKGTIYAGSSNTV